MKAALLARVNPLFDQAESELAKLQPRERALVGAAAIAAVILFIDMAIWRPAAHARSNGEARLADARQVAEQLERAAALAPHGGPGAVAAGDGSLMSIVDSAAKSGELSKPLTRMSPDGDTQLRVWLEDVTFDSLTHWMYSLQTRYGVRVDSVDIEQQPTPGLVNARLTLKKAS
jgi:general secretion pathway protein M